MDTWGPGAVPCLCHGPGGGQSSWCASWPLAVGSDRGAGPVLFWCRRPEAGDLAQVGSCGTQELVAAGPRGAVLELELRLASSPGAGAWRVGQVPRTRAEGKTNSRTDTPGIVPTD